MRFSLVIIFCIASCTFTNSLNPSITRGYYNWITVTGKIATKIQPNEIVLDVDTTSVPVRISTIDNQLAYINNIDFEIGDTVTVTGVTYPLKPNLIKVFTIHNERALLFPREEGAINEQSHLNIQTNIRAMQDQYFKRNVASGLRRVIIGAAITIAGVKIHNHISRKENLRHSRRLHEIAEMKASEVDPEDPDNDDWETPDEMITDLLEKLWYSKADVEYEKEMTLYSKTRKRNGLLVSSMLITSSVTFIIGLRDLNKAKKTHMARKETTRINISSQVSPTSFEITLITSF